MRPAAATAILLMLAAPPARAGGTHSLDAVNARLCGRVLDYTANHGSDRRIPSGVLGCPRDLYVYVPPGYDGRTPYPALVYLHGFAQDEGGFLQLVPYLDRMIRDGCMPPMVIAAPDGSISGRPGLLFNGSFYVNSKAGRFQDHILGEVWPFVRSHFCIRPERGAHVLSGASMGGFGAYNLGFKARDEFGVLVGTIPPLNTRYENCRGRYLANYDPDCVRFREQLKACSVVGRFYGVIVVRQCAIVKPLYGHDPSAIWSIAAENPAEMLATYDVKPGDYAMFIGYAGRDEFNLDAQTESFLDIAAARGIRPCAVKVPDGRHNFRTGVRLLPDVGKFLTEHVGPYAPPAHAGP